MAPTPSWPRAESMEASQSVLSGAMTADGLAGGRIPAAPTGALASPTAKELVIIMPMGSNVRGATAGTDVHARSSPRDPLSPIGHDVEEIKRNTRTPR